MLGTDKILFNKSHDGCQLSRRQGALIVTTEVTRFYSDIRLTDIYCLPTLFTMPQTRPGANPIPESESLELI